MTWLSQRCIAFIASLTAQDKACWCWRRLGEQAIELLSKHNLNCPVWHETWLISLHVLCTTVKRMKRVAAPLIEHRSTYSSPRTRARIGDLIWHWAGSLLMTSHLFTWSLLMGDSEKMSSKNPQSCFCKETLPSVHLLSFAAPQRHSAMAKGFRYHSRPWSGDWQSHAMCFTTRTPAAGSTSH